MAPLADEGVAFPADPAGVITVGVTGLADVVDVPECDGGDVCSDYRMLSGDWCRAKTPILQDVDCQYVNSVSMSILWAVFRLMLNAPVP